MGEHRESEDKVQAPTAFARWKEARGVTDREIAETVTRDHGVTVKRAMISAILRRERAAGPRLARALADLTGLPPLEFLNAETAALLDGSAAVPPNSESDEAA